MRHISMVALLLLSAAFCFAEERVTLDSGRSVNCREAHGLDQIYPFDLEEPVLRAPKGYEAFFIEHYGRHGSRFAYNYVYYDVVKAALDSAEAKGVLTEKGRSIKADYDRHYAYYRLRMGDLTRLGWEQQHRLGRTMAENYPSVFRRSESSVYAVSSDSRRSMMSMAGFCVGLGRLWPRLEIRADQGICQLNVTQPKSRNNPLLDENYPRRKFPFPENEDEFCNRKTDCCPGVLSVLFTDSDAALQGIGKENFLRRLYVLVAGMDCLDPRDRTDFSGVFSPEEFARMWEVDNYQRYREYYNYPVRTIPVLDDMIRDAEDAISKGKYGASLRFGHDHVVMPLLVLLRINGYGAEPSSADGISAVFAGFDCPMASNIQMVLYRSRKGGEILVNVRLNGRNATLTGLQCVSEGFYRWTDLLEAVSKCRESFQNS